MLFKTSLKLELKKAFQAKMFILILAVILAGLLLVYLIKQNEDTTVNIDIGFVTDGDSVHLEPIANELSALSLSGISFTRLIDENEESIKDKVANGEYLGIYVITDKLVEAVIEGRPKRVLSLYASPNFFINKMVTAWVYSIVMVEVSVENSVNVISNVMKVTREEVLADVVEIYDNYKENHKFVSINSSYYGGEGNVEEQATKLIDTRIYHGILALGILLLNCVMIPQAIDLYNKTHTRLNRKQRRQITLATMITNIITNLIVGVTALILINIFISLPIQSIIIEILALTVYIISMVSIFNIVAALSKDDSLLFSSTVFVFLVFLVLGGVLIDSNELGKILGGISKLIPSYYYQQATVYSSFTYVVPLALIDMVLATLSVLIGQRERVIR